MRSDPRSPMPPRRRRRELWPWALVGALLAMAAVMGAFLGVAVSHPDAVLMDDAFAASVRYDEAVRAADRATASGAVLEVALAPADGGEHVRVTLRDGAGRPLAADRVAVRRERPTEGGLDAAFEVTPDGVGWTAVVPLPRPGRWIVEARVERGDGVLVRRLAVEARP